MNIYLTTAVGEGPTELASFDHALVQSGIANFNLLYLSSVIPPNSTIIPTKKAEVTGSEWGDKLYVVMAQQRTSIPNQQVWAGIGWVQDPETKKGLFVEHEGHSEQEVRADIENSLNALMSNRNMNFGEIKMQVVGGTCLDKPICAMTVAVFQPVGWKK